MSSSWLSVYSIPSQLSRNDQRCEWHLVNATDQEESWPVVDKNLESNQRWDGTEILWEKKKKKIVRHSTDRTVDKRKCALNATGVARRLERWMRLKTEWNILTKQEKLWGISRWLYDVIGRDRFVMANNGKDKDETVRRHWAFQNRKFSQILTDE